MRLPTHERPLAETRGPGRPVGTGLDQRARLLDAAIACYGEIGISASSTRRIAAAAGVTPAMVHYYFGGKDQLRDAVVEERVMPVVGRLRERLARAGDDPGALISGFVLGMHAVVEEHPWLPTLWVREVLLPTGELRDLLIERIAKQIPRALAKRLADAQDRGALNAAVDPRLLVVSLIGLTLFPLAAAPIWRRMLNADDIDGDALVQHTLALLRGGIGIDDQPP
jgi:TetR/AcrR family transcriptional regulator